MADLTKYNEIKDLIKTGDIIQFRSNTLLGASIRFMTSDSRRQYEKDNNIDVNHTAGILRLPTYERDRRYLPESMEHGPSLAILSKRLEDLDGEAYWYSVPFTDDERYIWGGNALDCIGCAIPYGYKDILKFMSEQPEIDINNGLICSEYWMYCAGYRGKAMSPNGLTTLDVLKDTIPVRII